MGVGVGVGVAVSLLLLTLASFHHLVVHAHTSTPSLAHASTPSCHPSATQALGGLLRKEDYEYDVKFLPFDQQVSTYLEEGEAKRLMLPLISAGPLTITVTPCQAPLSWTLSLRPNTTGEEVVEESYEGKDPKVVDRETAHPGLYVLQMSANGGGSQVHVQAECRWAPAPTPSTITATPTPDTRGRALTLSWTTTSSRNRYCLAASEGQSFSSLCAARAARATTSVSGVVLGCTNEPYYQLPYTARRPLHVAVWAVGRPGPPLVTGLVPPRPRSRLPRLRPGRLLRRVLPPGGTIMARYRVRRRSRRLHVVAVACGGARLQLHVKSPSGKRVASAASSLGALYLSLQDSPPRTLLLQVKTTPPGAATRIFLTAAHTARVLPLPRPPRKTRIRVKSIKCDSATVKWHAAPGPYQFCLLLEKDHSGRSRRISPPRQCGWERILRQKAAPGSRWCSEAISGGSKWFRVPRLTPNTSYIATILSRHPTTRRTLALTPAAFSTPPCRAPRQHPVS
ncbi:hypothetical protein Pcinc_026496 [Petrolisthes cinctipes]|uniref:Fibronectin type-III domain-containing protein n=1 Tax=Petrolisthes cinctipes TaxID=88211 RepID=A0AAE1F6U4_PETCI|nr:hypothetical protein Pcinc_026496 [Petrolisthes cinctipes]